MRRYLTADLEWPEEIAKPDISISEIELILTDLELNFSSTGRQQVFNVLCMYSLDEYNEKHIAVKNDQRKEINAMLAKTDQFKNELFSFIHNYPFSESHDAYAAVSSLLAILDIRLRSMAIKGQGKDGGAPPKVALMQLVQRLVNIYKAETKEKFTSEQGGAWGRERSVYNQKIINYLSKVIGLITPGEANDLRKLVKEVQKKKYRPDIDLS